MRKLCVVFGWGMLALIMAACPPRNAQVPETDLHARAVRLARETGIIDTHVDLPDRLHERPADLTLRSSEDDFDFVRAREGGLLLPFMAIYVPSKLEGTGKAKPLADTLIDIVEGIGRRWPSQFTLVKSVADVGRAAGTGKVLLAMGMENGAPIEGSLDNLRYFYGRGIRYITLAHAKWNHLSDAAYDTVRHWNGLSPFGREVVAEMNRLGMMIDVSHLTDSAFYQILRISRAPVIASHSSCRAFTPGLERNMDDSMMVALGAHGGVLHINFGAFFLTEESYRHVVEHDRLYGEYLREHTLTPRDSLARQFSARFEKEHPIRRPTAADVAAHIDHAVRLAGIDHVGIGSDFEGVDGNLPQNLEDVSKYPNLIEELLKRGYSDAMIRKICSENLLRVWSAVERTAREEGQR